jgi:hypothetical protein
MKDGIPCNHPGCLNHVTHACEGCGRTAGRRIKMKTDITVVLDRSGSMNNMRDEVIGSYNQFLTDQKQVKGKARITLVQFDDKYQVDYEAIDILDAPPLSYETYQPRGMTSLYDAIGKTICSTNQRLHKKKPRKVIFLVQTDGQENNSTEYQLETVKSLINDHKSKHKWEFVFMGSDPTTNVTAKSMGIPTSNTNKHTPTKAGYVNAFATFSANTAQYRSGTKVDMSYEEKTADNKDQV